MKIVALVAVLALLAIGARAQNPRQCYAVAEGSDGKFNDGGDACTCQQRPEALDTGGNAVDATTVPTLLFGDGSTQLTGDELTLEFYHPVKFYDFTFQPSTRDTATPGFLCVPTWTTSFVDANGDADANGCYIKQTGKLSWTNAYRTGDSLGCGFTRTEDADKIYLKLDWTAEFKEDLEDLDTSSTNRETQNGQTRAIDFKFPIIIEFPKQATATSDDVVVFSPIRILSSITKVAITGDPIQGQDNVIATVDIFTSVQWPFRLTTFADDGAQSNAKININSVTEPAYSCDAGTSCDVNAWSTGSEDPDCPVCEQTVQFQLQPQAYTDEASLACNFDGQYGFTYKVECHAAEPAASACPLSTTADTTGSIQWTIETSSHCPQTVDVVTFSTKELLTYQDAAHTDEKDDFLDGQTVYFKATFVTDDVTVNAMTINTITLNRPNRDLKPDLALYESGANTADGDALTLANLVNSGVTLPGAESNPTFDLIIDSQHLGLVADEREIVRFTLVVDVTYENAGQAVKRSHKLQSVHKSQASGGARRPFESAAVANIGGQGSASTSNALFGVASGTVAIGAAGVGFLAAISMGVILIRSRRRRLAASKAEEVLATEAENAV